MESMEKRMDAIPPTPLIGVIFVAHGNLAQEFLNTVEYILGDKQVGMLAVSVDIHSNIEEKQREIDNAIMQVDCGVGVILVTDMFGGTPSNLAIGALKHLDRDVIYGANLPLIIKLAKSRHLSISEAKKLTLASGRKYISAATDILSMHSSHD